MADSCINLAFNSSSLRFLDYFSIHLIALEVKTYYYMRYCSKKKQKKDHSANQTQSSFKLTVIIPEIQ